MVPSGPTALPITLARRFAQGTGPVRMSRPCERVDDGGACSCLRELVLLILGAVLSLSTARAADDPRDIRTGWVIPDEGYCDQPYVVVTDDGHWLCVLTTGAGVEGQHGQHIVATRSANRGQ